MICVALVQSNFFAVSVAYIPLIVYRFLPLKIYHLQFIQRTGINVYLLFIVFSL